MPELFKLVDAQGNECRDDIVSDYFDFKNNYQQLTQHDLFKIGKGYLNLDVNIYGTMQTVTLTRGTIFSIHSNDKGDTVFVIYKAVGLIVDIGTELELSSNMLLVTTRLYKPENFHTFTAYRLYEGTKPYLIGRDLIAPKCLAHGTRLYPFDTSKAYLEVTHTNETESLDMLVNTGKRIIRLGSSKEFMFNSIKDIHDIFNEFTDVFFNKSGKPYVPIVNVDFRSIESPRLQEYGVVDIFTLDYLLGDYLSLPELKAIMADKDNYSTDYFLDIFKRHNVDKDYLYAITKLVANLSKPKKKTRKLFSISSLFSNS